MGVAPAYEQMRASTPMYGRFFSEEENQRRALVAVIGTTVARELFGEKSPIGEMIKINKVNFRVIGVLPEKGAAGPQDQDDRILLPVISAMYRLYGKNYVDSVDIEVRDAQEIPDVQDSLSTLMNKRHRVPVSAQGDAFNIFNMADIQQALNSTSQTMSMLLASIVVSACGGLLGIALGVGFSLFIAKVVGWTTVVSPSSVLLSFGFSALIGIIFGSYPASKASKLHPIEALRYE